MATSIVIEPIRIEVLTKPSKYSNGTYNTLEIQDKNLNVYSCIFKESMIIPNLGIKLEVIYQEVKGESGNFNHLLKFVETKEMAKTNTEGFTEKTTGIFKIKGKLFYAHVRTPETTGKYASGKYKADISISSAYKKSLEELGVLVKNKGDTKGDFVTVKSKYQPVVLDTDGTVLADIPLIGNGSTAIITVTLYPNKASAGGKNCLGFSSIQLINLISYEPKLLLEE